MQRVCGQIWSVLTAHAGWKADLSQALADQLPLSKLGGGARSAASTAGHILGEDRDLCAVA